MPGRMPTSPSQEEMGLRPARIERRPSKDIAQHPLDQSMPFSVIIFGATGDLARKKIFPGLYQLVLLGHFPRNINIIGYGRSKNGSFEKDFHGNLSEFTAKQCVNIKEQATLVKAEFMARISFLAGAYDSPDSFRELANKLTTLESGKPGNRLFYFSVPPTLFGKISELIDAHARSMDPGFTRLMIEKPFGRDTESFEELNDITAECFDETELYRMNHYVGKEAILNISTLRWANQLFEPTWNREYIESVQIIFKEDFGLGGRGGYFDSFGIIRDMMQNQLLQILLWIAMEPPEDMSAASIIESKVELLRCIETLRYKPTECFLGQFGPSASEPGYLDDEGVPKDSRCPTFASLLLQVDNTRWRGVPFLMTAGKGVDERLCEVRIRYKQKPHNDLIAAMQGSHGTHSNELVMRIQPDEALYTTTTSKVPGLTFVPQATVMDMSYKKQFKGAYVGDAYERLLLNAALGDQSLFASADELVEMWRIFTPLLHQIDEQKPDVAIYPFGDVPAGWPVWAKANVGSSTYLNSLIRKLKKERKADALEPIMPPSPAPPPTLTVGTQLHFDQTMPFSVIVFGATGDLARKKLFPALYQLVLLGHFPRTLNIVGYGRSKVNLSEFVEKQCVNVKEQPTLSKAEFMARITFHAGPYDSPESFKELAKELTELEGGIPSNRLYFLSVPPGVFGAVTAMINEHARAVEPGFTRLMIEKPFGRDTATFEELNDKTAACFHESQLYRLDHYLGKEVILNISTLRWANQLFEPTWNREYIESVQIVFKEDLGLGGRGGYFDTFGIIRDIMQNHLLQVMMWIAMDPPKDMSAAKTIEAKVELLKCIKTLRQTPKECFLGQFGPSKYKIGEKEFAEPGYLDDDTVPKDSRCPTFASLLLQVDNTRWRGVPFLMTAGKGLDERLCEVRMRYKQKTHNKLVTAMSGRKVNSNELVMRIQVWTERGFALCACALNCSCLADWLLSL